MVFVSGCKHKCKGCHNPTSHSFLAGQPFTEELQNEIIEYIKKTPFVSGLTLSGGDPMYSARELYPFLQRLKRAVNDTSVWVYSGFTFEEIVNDVDMFQMVELCDVLVDGKFVLEQRDPTLSYKGSSNQRIIDVQKTLKNQRVVLLEEGV